MTEPVSLPNLPTFPEREEALTLGHNMREAHPSSIEPPRGLYATCLTCGRSAWEKPDLQGGHGTAPTHGCDR